MAPDAISGFSKQDEKSSEKVLCFCRFLFVLFCFSLFYLYRCCIIYMNRKKREPPQKTHTQQHPKQQHRHTAVFNSISRPVLLKLDVVS